MTAEDLRPRQATKGTTRVGLTGLVVALDVSGDALGECRRVLGDAALAAVVGDALSLPLAQ